MHDARDPRRPISPWSLGAGLLAVFVALALFMRDSAAAAQVLIVGLMIIGLVMLRVARGRPASGEMADSSQRAPNSPGSTPLSGDIGALPPVLSARQTADYLGVDIAEVIAGLQGGELPGNRLGARWLIRKIALDAWLDNDSRRVAESTGR